DPAMRKLAALGFGMSVVALWLGCGGSESSSSSSSGGTDSGSDATTTKDTGPETSSLVDAPFDGFINAPEVSLTFGTCPTFAACGALGAMQLGFDKMTCADAPDAGTDGACNCDIEKTVTDNVTDTYEKSGSTITSGGGDTFDYCVAGSKLTYTQTNAPQGGGQ